MHSKGNVPRAQRLETRLQTKQSWGKTLFCNRSGKLANPCRAALRIADLRFSITASMPSTKPTLFREMSLICSWGRIGTTARPMVQTFDGSAETVEAFGRLERAKRRLAYAAADGKLS